jgi:hypothetical protein
MQDMEVVINKEIMKLKFEEKDFTQLGRSTKMGFFLVGRDRGLIFRSLYISRYREKLSFVHLG